MLHFSPFFTEMTLLLPVLMMDSSSFLELEDKIQQICLSRVIDTHEDTKMRIRPISLGAVDPVHLSRCCDWPGVFCASGKIHELCWNGTFHKLVYLDWIPPTVVRIDFEQMNIWNRTINTRALPRSIVICSLDRCNIEGSIDLQCLPNRLELLNLFKNKLSGTVHLTNLPLSIKTLKFKENCLQKVIVINSALPKCLVSACFHQQKNPKIVCLDGKEADSRVHTKAFIELDSSRDTEVESYDAIDG